MIYSFDDLTFQILRIDLFSHKEGVYEVKPRPYAALSLRVSGIGSFEISGQSFVSRPGDICFIPANTPYKVEYSISESIVVEMPECNYPFAENHSAISQEIISLFKTLLRVWNEDHSVNRAKSAIYDILERMSSDKKAVIKSEDFRSCVRYAEENFSDPCLDVAKLCEISFMSPSSLRRAFIGTFGISPIKYITKLRMNKALSLLSENELSVSEIAFRAGFTDEKYFSRAFKERYGVPPSRLRKSSVM